MQTEKENKEINADINQLEEDSENWFNSSNDNPLTFMDFMENYISLSFYQVTNVPISSIRKCPICGEPLSNYKEFPEWYPEKFRICCKCVDSYLLNKKLGVITNYYTNGMLIRHYEEYKDKIEEIFTVQ